MFIVIWGTFWQNHVVFLTYGVICDVILLYFTNFPLNRLFEQINLIFTKCIWRVKLLNMTYRTFWQNIYLIPCRVFDLWGHLLTSFCSILLIFPLDCLFEQLNLIFTKYLLRVKLFIITRGRFWQDFFW